VIKCPFCRYQGCDYCNDARAVPGGDALGVNLPDPADYVREAVAEAATAAAPTTAIVPVTPPPTPHPFTCPTCGQYPCGPRCDALRAERDAAQDALDDRRAMTLLRQRLSALRQALDAIVQTDVVSVAWTLAIAAKHADDVASKRR